MTIPLRYRPIYQQLYQGTAQDQWHYGQAVYDNCPGVRYFSLYRQWLKPKAMDFGCGSGDTVNLFRENNIESDGIDFINLQNDMLRGDITKPIDGLSQYQTGVCLDVLEHLTDKELDGLFRNMKQIPRQIFTLHTGPSPLYMNGQIVELHVNQRPDAEWYVFLDRYFQIHQFSLISPQRYLVFTTNK